MRTPAIITWKQNLSVGVASIDEDHKKLIRMINRLFGATLSPDPAQILRGVLDELTHYVILHFNREQEQMSRLNYPSYHEHIGEHAKLIDAVGQFKKNLESGLACCLGEEIEHTLRDWLITHIQRHDKRLGQFLNKQGIH